MEKNLTVSFNSDSGLNSEINYLMEVDSSYFETNNGENKSIFSPSDIVFLRLFPPLSFESYTLFSSCGELSIETADILYEFEEEILFPQTKIAALNLTPYQILSFSWIGNQPESVSFIGKNVLIPTEKTAILKIKYTVKGDRLKLKNTNIDDFSYPVLCVAEYEKNKVYSSVSFEKGETESIANSIINVALTIVDVVTNMPIENALVQVSGNNVSFSDRSNVKGTVIVPNVTRGRKYNVSVIAVGYYGTDEDYLNNDTFTVPLEDEKEEIIPALGPDGSLWV